ncbi:MAG: FAD-dependent oxidoreductase [Parachlamydiaceae bacterium]|nr:FAD-dependent oxidoreductase [Parachlamydiaceae bacterium]
MTQQNLNPNIISNNSGYSQSLWMEVEVPSFPMLDSNAEVDVCIVGAGIVGLTCAYTLAKQGKSVIVIDQGAVCGGQTARTTGHLTWVLDDRYYEVEKLFGEEGARLAAESHSYAIDHIEKIILEEQIDCDFERVDGFLFVAPGDSQEILEKEYACIKKMEKGINKALRAPMSSTFDTGPCLHYPRQAQFHILKYLLGLIKAIQKYNGKIFCNTHANHFEEDSSGFSCLVSTQSGAKITSHSVIVATCTPINDRFYIHSKQAPYRTYVIAASIPKDSVPKGLYWDTADPYHYIRIQKHLSDPTLDWLIIGGDDHKTGQEPEDNAPYDSLERWTKNRFSMVNKVEHRWSGQVFDPFDSLAFIGKNPGSQNTYIATGDYGNGMTHGTIAGILIPDLILGNSNPWKDLYEPSRKTLSAALNYIQENLNVAEQYVDWLTPGEQKQIEMIGVEEGIILRQGLKKVAVYKDNQNKINVSSAICPHLGACVRWNAEEKSWDCPCHGSRFNGCGKVLNGPSIQDLKQSKIN